jgi:hypothetical protein
MNANDSIDFVVVRFEGSSDGLIWIPIPDPELLEARIAAEFGKS